jgi:hypothetical protein
VTPSYRLCDEIMRDARFGMRTRAGVVTFNDEVTVVNSVLLGTDPVAQTRLRLWHL